MSLSDALKKSIAQIKLAIFDVDGVLTDGKLYFSEQGTELKVFHVQDGLGLKRLLNHGIKVAIISGRESIQTAQRMRELGVTHFYQGVQNKETTYQQLLSELNLQDHEVAYLGDDLPDLSLMQRVGFSIAVANAVEVVKQNAHWITERSGGNGAAREACELILKYQGDFS